MIHNVYIRLHVSKYLKRQLATEKAVRPRYVTRKTIPNPWPRQMGIPFFYALLRLSIFSARTQTSSSSKVSSLWITAPVQLRDKTAMCKVCFPWDRQIITFQLPSIPSADRARIYPEVLVFPRYMYTFFLVYQESSPSFRTSYDISLFDLSLSIAISKIFSMMIWIFFIIFVLLFASFIS